MSPPYRYALTIEYDGTHFSGWQRQAGGVLTVQQLVECAGEKLCGAPAPCVGAGRTDAGVHALNMAAHIDLRKEYENETVLRALNFYLKPYPIVILKAVRVTTAFNARFSCIGRSYLYRLCTRKTPPTLEINRVWYRPYALNSDAMLKAAKILVGRHDFTTFRAVACQARSPVKTITDICLERMHTEIHVTCHAPSFLHSQVRSIVGTLERVGAGAWSVQDVADALAAKNRAACGPVAPAHGLYFLQAEYPDTNSVGQDC